jgi:hypothetical protein
MESEFAHDDSQANLPCICDENICAWWYIVRAYSRIAMYAVVGMAEGRIGIDAEAIFFDDEFQNGARIELINWGSVEPAIEAKSFPIVVVLTTTWLTTKGRVEMVPVVWYLWRVM